MHGADRVDLLNRLSTNDLTALATGQGLQTVLITDKARIIDVLMVLNDVERSMVLASPNMAPRIIRWLRTYTITDDVRTTDASSLMEMVEVTGARAAEVVKAVTSVEVTLFTIGEWIATSISEQEVYVFRMSPTVELSYWMVGNPAAIGVIKERLQEIDGLEKPLAQDDVEYLRVMQGIGVMGHEWSEAYNPLEAGLLHLTSFTKGCYVGQEIIARLDSYNKVKQRVLGFVSNNELHVADSILVDNATVGAITTVAKGRSTNKWYALGYIRGEHAHPGASVDVRTNQTKDVDAQASKNSALAEIMLLPMVEQ